MEQKNFVITYQSVQNLTKYGNNAKLHPETQIEKIARSIELYGFDQPIIVDAEGVIIKGHGRLLAAQLLGLELVPVIVRDDLTSVQAAAARIADNKVAESPWDENLLPMELSMLQDNDVDIHNDLGFDYEEIENLFNDAMEEKEKKEKSDSTQYIVLIECISEHEQQKLYEELSERGIKCKLIM